MLSSRSVGLCVLLVSLAVLPSFVVHGQTSSPRATATTERPWSALTPAQQAALRPLQTEWRSIDAARRVKWVQVADRLPTLPPEEQARIQARMTDWARMTPRERGEARLNYKEVQQLRPEDRRARWEAYKALPPDRQKELASRRNADAAAARSLEARRNAPGTKSTLVPNGGPVTRPSAIAPSVAQAGPGATTILVNKRPAPPPYQQPGLPKVATGSTFVDSKTLLPKRGAQAAGSRPAKGASAPLVVARP